MDSTIIGYVVDGESPDAIRKRLRSGTQVVRSGSSLGVFARRLAEDTRSSRPEYQGALEVYVWWHDPAGHLLYGHHMAVPAEAERYEWAAGQPTSSLGDVEDRGPAIWGLM